MTEKHEDLDDVVTDEIVEQTLEEMDGKAPAPKEDPDATSPEDAVASVDKVVKDAPPKIKKVHPKTKAGMISAMMDDMQKMSKQDLQMAYANYNKMEQDKKEEEEVKESLDTSAELSALVESEATLSEEFKQKTAILFETALKSKLSEEVDRLEAQYKEDLAEEVSSTKSDLVEKVDNYLNYVVETWMEENKLAVEAGLRTEIAETFMNNLKDLFTESYIEVPESKIDLVDDLVEQVEELESQLNSQTEKNMEMSESVKSMKKEVCIREASKDLAETQVEKLRSLAESVDFTTEEDFASKISTLKESYFAQKPVETTEAPVEMVNESVVEEEADETEISSNMDKYLSALRTS